jgi:uncharacterized iron-regulated membrane protein
MRHGHNDPTEGDVAMDAMSIAALIVIGLVALATGVYVFKPEKKSGT